MKNLYEQSTKVRDKVLRRFSAFDGTGSDLRSCTNFDEALATADLDYSAKKRKLFLDDGSEVKDFFASVKDNEEDIVLGVVGNQYTPISNREAFGVAEEIAKSGWNYEVGGPVIGSHKHLDYSKSFLVLRGEDFNIKDDVFNSFVIFNNSFNGSCGINYKVICQRVVCLNGMTRFLGGKKNQLTINIQHSKTASDRIKVAKEVVGERLLEIEAIKREAEIFMNTKMTRQEFESEIIPQILKIKKLVENNKDRERGEERVQRVVQQVLSAYDAEDTQNYNGTAYKVLLALSDFETHAQPMRDTGNPSIYLNNLAKGMILTTQIANYIANTRNIRIS